MGARLLSVEGRDEFRRIDSGLREERARRVAAMTVGERLELGLALSRSACEVREAFAGKAGRVGRRA